MTFPGRVAFRLFWGGAAVRAGGPASPETDGTLAHRTSVVRSVYFDDEGLGGYVDSVEGSGTRRKIRLRWYDDGDNDGRFFFEIKRRAFELVVKERIAVESERALGTLRYRDILRHLVAALPAS